MLSIGMKMTYPSLFRHAHHHVVCDDCGLWLGVVRLVNVERLLKKHQEKCGLVSFTELSELAR